MASTAEQLESIQIGGIPSADIMRVWSAVEPVLRRVVNAETGHTMQSVLTALQMAKMQLWVIGDFQGVVITQIEDRPAHRVLFTMFLAGDRMSEWIDDWCEVQDAYGRHNNCVAVEFNGRKGWNKIGERKPEWKALRTVFRRELGA